MTSFILVEIVFAEPQRAWMKSFMLPQGARVADALLKAADEQLPSPLDVTRATFGIYGQVVSRDHVLEDGDRIEIYRPLAEDPKAARRKRAKKNVPRTPVR